MSRGKSRVSPKFKLFTMIAAIFMANGVSKETANKRAHHQSVMGGGNPEYLLSKHPKMTYDQQNRIAKKNRKARAKAPK